MEEEDVHVENGFHASSKESDRQQRLRLCVLNEILNTERAYVRTLLFLQSVSRLAITLITLPSSLGRYHRLSAGQSESLAREGTNLTDISTELLLHGNLLKISAGNIQERVFFLFDNLLVYCKRKSRVSGKKSTKRTKSLSGPLYVFRGRINTEVMEVENVEDGTADYHSNNYTVTNGWKIHNTAKNKWFVCMAKNTEDKQKWLDAILREREQRESLKLGMERDAYVMIAEKGEKLYHMMMSKSRHLIKDRRRKLSNVPKCFMGNEFVSWLLESGEISKPDEGVNLGQALLENGIIHHVSDKHQFKNEQVLYRFRYDDGTYKARSEMEDIMSKGVRLYCRMHSLHTPVIKDRDHHLKTFRSVVPGYKLVDWLLSQRNVCGQRSDVCVFPWLRSECNSNRDSVLSYTSVRSNSSYLGSDEMGSGDELPWDMRIPSDKQDKLHGCLEHLFNQVDSINSLLKGPVMTKACEETKHFHPDHSQPEFRHTEDWTVRCRCVIHKNIQEDPWNLPSSIRTLVDSLQRFVEDGKNQLLLALLKCTDTSLQLRRDVIFCQAAGAAVLTLAEQLLAALRARYNNAGEYQEDSKETSRKWLEQVSAIGVLLHFQSSLAPHLKEERTMLEDTKAALLDLDKLTVFFKQTQNEYLVPNTPVSYQVDGGRQALRVTLLLDSCHFSELPGRLQNGGSLKLHTVLFTRALERPEGSSQQDFVAMEEFQQRTNAVSLERVKAYYRKLRAFYLEKSNLQTDSNTTAMKIDQLLRPLNTLDDLCRLMQSYVNVRPSAGGHPSGVSVLSVSSELCNRLGACHVTMCATGMQRCTLSVTLEQAMILARNHGLIPRCIMQTMDIMRKQGTRVELFAKNLKVMDQMPPSAPRLFRLCLPPSDGDL
ncbi:phosphatidylinositol 3,4,5-trisphosphate-dependent Rac exchanger 1 protein [Gadus chalcogrammus]|uniref:phosphatidylinositol 3,4,5-trisphosphate-dependent Rac exchanger 1 protein n=1 Tax=Gadus chalcogrammus TaxID=1042646 RepID=UPI0024C35ACE|nr:phosphatidylinositol 3,4,5-trisphosphate-dependent Rac exchanger 1 protein [Gadus chalcogrammus]